MECKTYFLRTYGCQMNELDSEIIKGYLEKMGLQEADEKQADLLLFNTCSIRDLAERKVLGKIGLLSRRKKNYILGIMGCLANAKKELLWKKFPHLDFILGTNNLADLEDTLNQVLLKKEKICKTDQDFTENLDYQITKRNSFVKAQVSIIRGCNKFCTYCVVPYTRGKEVSRPSKSIIEECKGLVDKGFKEITLLGQNVNSYGKDQPEWGCLFPDLLEKLDKISGLERIRFLTSHPMDISLDLLYAMRDFSSVCEFLHFPIQSGSNRILRKMHRSYTKEEYLEKVLLLQKLVPDIQLGTDIIVGFPTETEEEFLETYQIFQQIRYSVAFIFSYSPRKGTPAYRFLDDVPKEVKEERLQRLLTLHKQICHQEREKKLGSTVEVLVEGFTKSKELVKGRTRGWEKVIFPGEKEDIGKLKEVVLESQTFETFIGKSI